MRVSRPVAPTNANDPPRIPRRDAARLAADVALVQQVRRPAPQTLDGDHP